MAARSGDVSRLDDSVLGSLPQRVRPAFDRADLTTGIVHLGLGAFHRAHQAVYTANAITATGDTSWGIAGVSPRSGQVVADLRPQNGLYTVLQRDTGHTSPTIPGAIHDLVHATAETDRLLDLLAASTTRVVTLTVTEKAYRFDAGTKALRLDDEAVRADLAGAGPTTVVGFLVRGLQRRLAAEAAPITIACCDNLTGNGEVLAGLVRDFVGQLPANEQKPLIDFLDTAVRFPSTMVDRIVPATTPEDLAEVTALLGVEDHAAVVAEPFTQWIIEDDFAGPRPAWEQAGAIFTGDVTPFEQAKLRVLNGAHSTLAYLGGLAGHEYLADAADDDVLNSAASRLHTEDVLPTLEAPDGLDLVDYHRSILKRFTNHALRHRTAQIAMDGSQKVPIRLLGTIRDRLAADAEPRWATLGVAAWLRYTTVAKADDGSALTVSDPMSEKLSELAAGDPASNVDKLLAVSDVFDAELAENAKFRSLIQGHLVNLSSLGARGAVRAAGGH